MDDNSRRSTAPAPSIPAGASEIVVHAPRKTDGYNPGFNGSVSPPWGGCPCPSSPAARSGQPNTLLLARERQRCEHLMLGQGRWPTALSPPVGNGPCPGPRCRRCWRATSTHRARPGRPRHQAGRIKQWHAACVATAEAQTSTTSVRTLHSADALDCSSAGRLSDQRCGDNPAMPDVTPFSASARPRPAGHPGPALGYAQMTPYPGRQPAAGLAGRGPDRRGPDRKAADRFRPRPAAPALTLRCPAQPWCLPHAQAWADQVTGDLPPARAADNQQVLTSSGGSPITAADRNLPLAPCRGRHRRAS